MYYVQVLCVSCASVQHDLDVVLDVGSTMPVPDECWSCGYDEFEVGLRYASEEMASYETYRTGPAFDTNIRE